MQFNSHLQFAKCEFEYIDPQRVSLQSVQLQYAIIACMQDRKAELCERSQAAFSSKDHTVHSWVPHTFLRNGTCFKKEKLLVLLGSLVKY